MSRPCTNIERTIDLLLAHEISRAEAISRLTLARADMPSLTDLAVRRAELRLSLRDVAKATGVSHATISRIEKGENCDFANVKRLFDWYSTTRNIPRP